jgi:hypothetical protein
VIAWRNPQVLILIRVVQHLESSKQAVFDVWWNLPAPLIIREEALKPGIPETQDQFAPPL